ncbi:MAG TPA: S41 family peptidase [Kiritimatiellia bacterium]|nr:S41 family peptidase [Kiritimatiellia bacterium]HPV46334.1 S41 family peptidase [Kiritimatiellia bacterium]
MNRLWNQGRALCLAGLWLAVHASAQSDEPAAVEPAADAAGLCATIAEGERLLAENHLPAPDDAAKGALLEALLRASEPTVVFLDEEELASRCQQEATQEWTLGLTLVEMEDSLPKIVAVAADTPAATAGIQPGEFVQKIGDQDLATGATLKQVRSLLLAGEEPELAVSILDPTGQSRALTLVRTRRERTALTNIEDLPVNMGYMRAAGIFTGAGAEIVACLDKWQAAGKIGAILDLREADGTAEDEVAIVAAKFTPRDDVLYTMNDRQGHEIKTVKATAPAAPTLPLMVLVDGETCGAAELLAAVLSGSVQGAMVIGQETAGDPLIREAKQLPTGRYALLATRQLKAANGAVYAGGRGVQPDVVISSAALHETFYEPESPVLRKGKTLSEEEKEDRALRDRTRHDAYLRRATDVLLGLKALGYGRQH